jgi:NADH-quinone oxidoreductase subunit L
MVPEILQPATAAVFDEAVHGIHTTAMILSILIAAGGILLAFSVYQWKKISADKMADKAGFLYKGAFNKWYFDEMYDKVFVGGLLLLTRIMKWFDENIIDGIVNGSALVMKGISTISGWIDNNVVDGLVNATATSADRAGSLLSKIQTGKIQTYLVYVVFSFLVLFVLFM